VAIIELRTTGRPAIAIGGATYSSITLSLISLPNSEEASLQVSAARQGESAYPSWDLVLPNRGDLMLVRWKKEGECAVPSTEWLLDRSQLIDSSRSRAPVRAERFTCMIRLSDEKEYNFTVAGNFTFQLTLEHHFARLLPRLIAGCFAGDELQSESWFDRSVPYDEDFTIVIGGI